jgi:hypothetical protein
MELIKGNLYRIRSRNLPYGVYDGLWFIGIREKFGCLYLSTESGIALEDLGPVPQDLVLAESLGRSENKTLYDWLAAEESRRERVPGYGIRPGDED